MRKFKGAKLGKRVLSAALAVGMVVAMLPLANLSMVAKAEKSDDNMKYYTAGGKDVVRGVVGDITELPQYGKADWTSAKVGTAARPFTILELVPYEEYAEFGYLISGCEPVNIKQLQGDSDAIMYVNAFNAADVKQTNSDMYFFTDEPAGKREYYPKTQVSDQSWNNMQVSTEGITVRGYYEVVEDGKGDFVVETGEDGKKSIVKKSKGNVVWHSLHSNVDGYGDITKMGFSQKLDTSVFENVGDTLYTTRVSSAADPLVNAKQVYYSYKNKDIFLRDTIGLTDDNVDTYSVVVKVITPDELNKKTDWVEYADLIYISRMCHGGSKEEKWEQYNYLGHKLTANKAENGFLVNDLSWDAVRKILDKNTRARDYAALMIDSALYEAFESSKKSGIVYQAYDFNLDPLTAYNNNTKRFENSTFKEDGRNSNIYKLFLMVGSVNPNIVKQIFLDHLYADRPTDPTSKIKMDLQTGDAAEYWSDHIFQLVDKETYNRGHINKWYPAGGYIAWDSVLAYLSDEDNKETLWNSYNYLNNIHTERNYVQNRLYAYNGDTSIAQKFRQGSVGSKDKTFQDFNDYVKTDEDTKVIWENLHPGQNYGGVTGNNSAPSAALRYILGIGKDFDTPIYGGTLKILDVEPAIGIKRNYQPDWKIKDVYFRMMLPNFTGNIIVEHMTMNSFVGRTDDLNSTYDLIYLGSDSNAFWQKENGDTDFVDDSMDGWVYFHIGDIAKAGAKVNNNGVRTGNFIAGITDNSVRFAGNDITMVKIKDLVNYMDAGFPIVADAVLYNTAKMDKSSNIYQFITLYDSDNVANPMKGKSGVYDVIQGDQIEAHVRNNMVNVTFNETPVKYDEVNYLPRSGDYALMKFDFDVPTTDYSFRIYVDQNRNGKFESNEVIRSGAANLNNAITCSITKEMVGLIQWRIEVFKTANENIRDSREGCSAIQCLSASAKKKIKVLQIIPKSATNADLTASNYKNLYNNLDAFSIEVDKITWAQFENYFVGGGFKFDMGEEISVNNPKMDVLNKVESPLKEDGTKKDVGNGKNLNDYNMIVVGFYDNYDKVDLSDVNGAAEYLYYYTMSGRSILFTHDNTSLYNLPSAGASTKDVVGYTANAMLRDIMGMNRYGVNSTQLDSIRSGLASDMTEYRENRVSAGLLYDTTSKAEKQGFTLNAMRKLGQNITSTYRFPYKYMVKDPANVNNNISSANGFGDDNCTTSLAVRLNEGQITEYPYNITRNLTVATTHSQWYQLNMEDPEVTVWFTLEYPAAMGLSGTAEAVAKAYAATPQDAANNYYIYSKGNIFYSGVGHSSTNNTEMERKLFINTMIAAYRAAYEPPAVEITNPEASVLAPNSYALRVPQEFNFEGGSYTVEDFGGNTVKVSFRPVDSSFSNSIKVRIYYKGTESDDVNSGNSIATIYDSITNQPISAVGSDSYFIPGLENVREYYFYYEKSRIKDHPELTFEAMNDRIPKTGFSYLKILAQPLFKLD